MKKIRLGDIATLITKGTTPTTIGFSFVDTGVNFVKIESISENGEFLSDKFAHITDECDNKLKRSQLEENDILFSIAGAIGRTAIVPRSILPANTNQALAIIRIPQNAINLRFVLYALQSQAVEEQSEKQKQGVAQLNLSLKNIADILIPLVSSEKQNEIVRNLAAVDAAIAIRKEQIRLIDQVVKSRFIELFGDYDLTHPQESWVTIKEIGTVIGGATPKTDHDEYWGGSYRWITPAELDADSGYIYDSVRKLTKAGVESCSLQEMPVGTVILSSRAPIGKVAIAGNTFYCNQGFKNIICMEGITPRYLYTVLLLNVEYLNSLGRGATFKEISKGIVESIRIPVPSMELQEQFASFVEQTDKSKYYKSIQILKLITEAIAKEVSHDRIR